MPGILSEINKLAFVIAPIFWQLVYRSILAAIMGFVWIGICKIFENFFAPNDKSMLFYLLLVALIRIPVIENSFSLSKYIAPMQNISYREEYDLYEQQLFLQKQAEQAGEDKYATPTPVLEEKVDELYAKSLIFDVALPLIWLGGVAAGGIWLAISAAQMNKALKKGTPADNRINEIYQQQLKTIDRAYKIPLIITDVVSTPATTGLLKKKILLPAYVQEMDDETVGYILLHELCHIKGAHLSASYISLVLQVVYWFNPFIHFLFTHNKQNMELLADMEVLKYTDNHKNYAFSMVNVLSHSRENRLDCRLLCMADNMENMKKRIASIKQTGFFKKNGWKITLVSVLVGTATVLLFQPVELKEQPAYIADSYGAMTVEKSSSIGGFGMRLSCNLPWNWISRNPVTYPEDGQPVSDSPLPPGMFETTTYLLQDDELIGYIGFSTFEPYTDEILQEEYHKTAWPQLRLSAMSVWDPFTSVKQTETGEIGLVDINYLDYEYFAQNPDTAMAAVPHYESFGIIGYNKEDGVYAAVAFVPGKVSRETAIQIAQSMEISYSDIDKPATDYIGTWKEVSLDINGHEFDCKLPTLWNVSAEGGNAGQGGVPVPLGEYDEFEHTINVLNGSRLIGRIGVSSFVPYEGEIARENYYQTVFSLLRLSSFFVWDPFETVAQTETGEKGVVDIYYVDYLRLEDYPGAKAGAPHYTTNGAWAYDKQAQFYVCFGFIPGMVSDADVLKIAESIEFKQ